MRTKYYVRITNTMADFGFDDQKEAFDFARECKATNMNELVTLNRRVWADNGRIVEYNTVAIKPDGTFEILY